MQTLLSNAFWVVREYREHKLVQVQRSRAPFESLLDVEVAVDGLLQHLSADYGSFGVVVDSRSAPLRSDGPFQAALQRARSAFDKKFARVALLVRSHTGVLQATRLVRESGSKAFVTMSETAAFEYAKGLAVTNKRNNSAVDTSRIASPDPLDEASHWAKELDQWAVVREKVLTKIDIRAARRARALASEIRRSVDIAWDLVEHGSGDIGRMAPLLDELAALRIEAVELMLGTAPAPRRAPITRDEDPQSSGTQLAGSHRGSSEDSSEWETAPTTSHIGKLVRTLDRASTSGQVACQSEEEQLDAAAGFGFPLKLPT